MPVTATERAIRGAEFLEVDPSEIDYELPSASRLFGTNINSISAQNAVHGTRLFYGARFFGQANPIRDGEEAWVQNLDDATGQSFDRALGRHLGAVFAPEDGEVLEADDTHIKVRFAGGDEKDIPLYKRLPFNRKTALRQTPTVQAGDVFTAGSAIARSNYTTPSGTAALGKNARVALVPYLGHTMDDAIAIRQGFADSLVSDHMYGYELDEGHGVKVGLNHFRSIFPKLYDNKQLDKLDDTGVVRVGEKVEFGDPLIVATSPRAVSSKNAQEGRVGSLLRTSRNDSSVTWQHRDPGVVTDVSRGKKGYKVFIQSDSPTKDGDKLVFRTGNKGVVSVVIPDEDMPRTEDGQLLDILQNPLGLNSRINDSLAYELLLGKLAERKGEPIAAPGFNKDWWSTVHNALREAGVPGKERIYDPKFDRWLDQPVTVGNGYILKLHHEAEGKSNVRSQGAYDQNELPLKGSGDAAQAKRYSGLEVSSGLSAGIYNIMRDKIALTGTKNQDYWKQYRQGLNPRYPDKPFAYDKLKALLGGAGVMVRNMKDAQGRKVERVGFLTQKDINTLNPVEITNPGIVDLSKEDLPVVKGGLFDPSVTGTGRWGKVRLPFKMVNPAFEENARVLLGLTKKQVQDLVAGRITIDDL